MTEKEAQNGKRSFEILPEQLRKRSFCIYGAGIVAASVYTAVRALYHNAPLFFLVSDEAGDGPDKEPEEIDGISVKGVSAWQEELRSSASEALMPDYYLIAVPEVHHSTIVQSLQSVKFAEIEMSQLILVTNSLENALMESYYSSFLKCRTVCSLIAKTQQPENTENRAEAAGEEGNVQVLQAKCHKDKPLHNRRENRNHPSGRRYPGYVYPIQVGAALTDQVIAGLQDNRGDHISAKNGNYSELTATYYAWKNIEAAYKGICHYRRVFDISEEQMGNLCEEGTEWDVILPYPTVHYPNIAGQHTRYLKEQDWDALLRALKECAPAYFEAYQKILNDGERYFYNFNMLIARAEVFDDYCSFLFSVLERAEALVTPKGGERSDRFAGYMGENLTTIYFHSNKDRLKIAYAGKIWLT